MEKSFMWEVLFLIRQHSFGNILDFVSMELCAVLGLAHVDKEQASRGQH